MVTRTHLNIILRVHCLVVSEDANDAVFGLVLRNKQGRFNFMSCSFLATSLFVAQRAFVSCLIMTLRKTPALFEI